MNEELLNSFRVFLAVRHRKTQTQKTYYYPVKRFLEWLNDRPINQENINLWVIHQNINDYRHNGIMTRIVAVNKFLKHINKPELKIKTIGWKRTYRKTISFHEIQQMMQTAKKLGAKHYLVLRFITDLDCRPNEICNAKWSNIIGDKFYFDDTKTGDNYGFITPGLRDALEKYHYERPTPNRGYEDYILIGDKSNNKGKNYSNKGKTIICIVREIAYHTHIERKINPYDLRASVITEEFNHYVNPQTIQRKARHKNQLTTQRYNHIDDQMVKDYVNYDLIFDKPIICDKEKKQRRIYFNLSREIPPQDLNKTLENEDTNNFSFSIFSFYQTSYLLEEHGCWSWGFSSSLNIEWSLFDFIQGLPQLHISPLGAIS